MAEDAKVIEAPRASADTAAPSSAPSLALDAGLAGLALVAAYYRIAADPLQLRHQLALTGRTAGCEDLVRGANLLGLKSRMLKEVRPKRFARCRCRRSSV